MKLQTLASLLAFSSIQAFAGDWQQWRGPEFNGTSPEKGLPEKWSQTEGVKWSLDLPGISGATPIVSGGLVFVMSPDAENKQWLMAVDRKTGKLAWKQNIADGALSKGRGNSTSPSPVTDGKTVGALVGTGQLVAFDFTGKEVWRRDLAKDYGKFNINWVYGSSPLLHGGHGAVGQALQPAPRCAHMPRNRWAYRRLTLMRSA